jgi:hypothetical protein
MKYFGSTSGLTTLAEDTSTPANGMVAYVTSSYNSGYQNGDIKLATLSDTDDTDLVGGTDADRSVNGNDLTVNGTITRSPVATGADLVAYSGFSASNYLEQPYNSDLDFGTGDFCVMGWVKTSDTDAQGIVSTQDLNLPDVGLAVLKSSATGGITFITADGTDRSFVTGNIVVDDGSWHHFAAFRTNSGTTLSVYVDGKLDLSGSVTARDIAATNKPLAVGQWLTNSASAKYPFGGSLALLRISATAPSPEQIKKIYEDEKVIFQENAQATLYAR